MEQRRRPEQTPGRQTKKKSGAAGKIFRVLGTLALIGICTGLMLFGIFMKYVNTTLAPSLVVNADDYTMALSSFIYYEDKETGEWKEWQTVYGEENRVLAEYSELPENLLNAAVAIEDERFYQHNGVDWKRTLGATLNFFTHDKDTFGGSTITQQVLKNMTQDKAGTVNRKIREIFRALKFEENNTKEQILTMYLNTIYLGKGCYGVKTAAEFYFGKDVSELSLAECASLIAITNNPSLYGPMYDITYTREDGTKITPRELNKQRQENILTKMSQVGKDGKVEDGATPFITEEEAKAAKAEVLQFRDDGTTAQELVERAVGGVKINSWFVDQVILDVSADLAEKYGISVEEARLKIYNSGYNIYTTLDPKIQSIAESVYGDRSNLDVTSRKGQQLQSGITIIDPYTGNIVATVGKIGEKTGNLDWSFATTSKRQPGSSIKPLTCYAPAIDAGAVTPGTVFDNYPVQLLNDNPWPKNSPPGYTGLTTVAEGLRRSINTIAVQTVQAVGIPESYAFATEKLKLSLVPDDMGLSPLGMGGLTHGLNTVEMAAAYACFVNQGIYNEPRTYLRVTKPENDGTETVVLENEGESHVAMKETTAYLVNQMLKTVVNGGAGSTGTAARFNGMTIAGKTGTTDDNRDRYFVGFSPYYCAAVWTGYESNDELSYGMGNGSAQLWKQVMREIHADLEDKAFDSCTGLTQVTVCSDSGLLATDACTKDLRGSRVRTVTVAADTAPTTTCNVHKLVDYCTEGKHIATQYCPKDKVKQVAVLDWNRALFNDIKARDHEYLLKVLDGSATPNDPKDDICPAHQKAITPVTPTDPTTPTPPTDPTDPTTPDTGGAEDSGGVGGGGSWWKRP